MSNHTSNVRAALDAARQAQEKFWAAVGELELILGGDVGSNRDLSEVSAEQLVEEYRPEEEE